MEDRLLVLVAATPAALVCLIIMRELYCEHLELLEVRIVFEDRAGFPADLAVLCFVELLLERRVEDVNVWHDERDEEDDKEQ